MTGAHAISTSALLDRLLLDDKRVEAMAKGVEEVAALPDPVGRELARWTRPNGLDIARVSTPIGVIGIIYESRPNVTADAGALCLKSGNAVDPARRLGIGRALPGPFMKRWSKACARRDCRKPRSR